MNLRPLLLLALCGACTAPPSRALPARDGGCGDFTGPPSLELGTPEAGFTPLQDGTVVGVEGDGDGGVVLTLALRAHQVELLEAAVVFTLADPAGMRAVSAPALYPVFTSVGAGCVAAGVRAGPFAADVLVDRLAWLSAQLTDRDGRVAWARQRVRGGVLDGDGGQAPMEPPDGGTP
ncbi:MAG: hypothetical protein HY904_14125 [Deltaproteobacteria bacterium]|nr:hypothetical protein [Deltaproteobacteria bacterium]